MFERKFLHSENLKKKLLKRNFSLIKDHED